MATLKPELRAILDECGIDPRDKTQIWDCHGTLVLYHKAYEIIAAKRGIKFDPPTVIEAHSESKIVALCVVGHWGDRTEWSIGEAAPGNNKNAYPYAMAEKRAKDRVVAKLVGLAAHVYSEDEADSFKDDPREPVERTNGAGGVQPIPTASAPQASPGAPRSRAQEEWFRGKSLEIPTATLKWTDWRAKYLAAIHACRTSAELKRLETDNNVHVMHYAKTARPEDVESFRLAIFEGAQRFATQLVA